MQGALAGAQSNYVNVGNTVAAAPRTISSASSRLDALNERLASIRTMVAAMADQIGGPHPTAATAKGESPEPNSAVSRLNGSADAAHNIVTDIEEMLKAIGRALG